LWQEVSIIAAAALTRRIETKIGRAVVHARIAARAWGGSSVGRASRSQCEGRGFDPLPLHHILHTKRFPPYVGWRTDKNGGELHNRRLLERRRSVQWNATATNRVVMRMLVGGTLMAPIAVVCAGEPASITYTSRSPRMLYVSVTLWSPGTSSRLYELRLGQLRSLPASPHLGAIGSSQIKELLSLQIAPYSDTRMVFAKHLTWNLTRGAFGSQSNWSGLMVVPSIAGISITDTVLLHPSGPRVSSVRSIAGFGRGLQPAANTH
jgi:hypothetical protein